MTDRLKFIEVEHEWGTTHHFEYKGNRIQEYEVAEKFNELYKENEELKHQLAQQEMEYATDLNRLTEDNGKLKQLLQAIITKEFELSSDDSGYDPLSEFFNNEVSISQIEVEIDVEKK